MDDLIDVIEGNRRYVKCAWQERGVAGAGRGMPKGNGEDLGRPD